MGYYGKLVEKEKVQNLRKQGLSYREIQKLIPVSKDSISRWCRNIVLTDDQKYRLSENKNTARIKGSRTAAGNKRDYKNNQIAMFHNRGIEKVGDLSSRDKFIAGIAFYLSEGTKFDGKCEFTNSDPRLIQFMMEWFREFFNIPEVKFRGAIWLHDDLDNDKAKKYWVKVSGIPANQFHKTYLVKKKSNMQLRKQQHQFGIFSIRFVDVSIHRQIMGLTCGILKNYMV